MIVASNALIPAGQVHVVGVFSIGEIHVSNSAGDRFAGLYVVLNGHHQYWEVLGGWPANQSVVLHVKTHWLRWKTQSAINGRPGLDVAKVLVCCRLEGVEGLQTVAATVAVFVGYFPVANQNPAMPMDELAPWKGQILLLKVTFFFNQPLGACIAIVLPPIPALILFIISLALAISSISAIWRSSVSDRSEINVNFGVKVFFASYPRNLWRFESGKSARLFRAKVYLDGFLTTNTNTHNTGSSASICVTFAALN